jgi:hypothetical protein
MHLGENVLGATVLYYGHGEGTWPFGRPGFLFWLELEHADGSKETLVSDESWQVHLCRAWQPGRYQRWYLRALQEEFNAQLYPHGWSLPGFETNADWLNAMPLKGSPNKPALCTDYNDYLNVTEPGPSYSELRPRSIPLLDERLVPVKQLSESLWVKWLRPAAEYLENRGPNCFIVNRKPSVNAQESGRCRIDLNPDRGAVLTFELTEQVVGFPYFSIEAPAGTVVDLLTQEGHQVGAAALLYTTMNYGWTRFVCRAGENTFECFDYESLRWIQLHIQGCGPATVHSVGVRRRLFPWSSKPIVRSDEPALQRLFDANINTLLNAATDRFVDGNGRERQQYSGDCAHQVSAALLVFGDARLSARFLDTWSQGLMKEGYFLDCWPGLDRLERIKQREVDMSTFGPLLEHGVQFGLTAWDHYMFTGDLEPLREPYPRLLRFADYLNSLINRDGDGLLPVTDLGIPTVWMDWEAYKADAQRRKQCAFNLYVAAMFDRALAPMCTEFGDDELARTLRGIARELLANTVKRFWSAQHRLFVDNLPWLSEEGEASLSDLTLAMAVLFDQCPDHDTDAAILALATRPKEMGLSYPANAIWRLWALSRQGRIDVVVEELRTRWANQTSVMLNNTLGEDWSVQPDSWSQWSHAAVAPLSVAHLYLVGLRPLLPGFRRAELRPQLGDLNDLEIVTHTGVGPVHFKTSGRKGNREMQVTIPSGCACDLILHAGEKVPLQNAHEAVPAGHQRYRLPSGETTTLHLMFT